MADYVFALDGKIVDRKDAVLPVLDHGFLFGDSVYEVVRTVGGRLFAAREHLKRLHASARGIALKLPWPDERFAQLMREMHAALGAQESHLRVMVTRGEGELTLDPSSCGAPRVVGVAKALPVWPREHYRRGCKVVLARVRRNPREATDPGIKSGNYLNNVLALMEARKAGAAEAVMLGVTGHLTEATTSNVFIARRGVLVTPALGEGILAGVTRGFILKLCRRLKIRVIERAVKGDEFLNADEAFLSSTTRDVMPIGRIGGKKLKHAPGPVTLRLLEAYQRVLHAPGNLS